MKNVKIIDIIIEGDDWKKALDKTLKKNIQKVQVDGFRKGMVPKEVFLKKYGIESLYSEAMEAVAPLAYDRLFANKDLDPVIEPIVDVTSIDENKVCFKFTIISKPEITLGEYKNLGIKKEEAKITKEEIEEEIASLKQQLVEIVPKDSEIVSGDIAIIDFEGFIDGKTFEGGKGENYKLEIGSHTFIPGFEEGLVGLKNNDQTELNLTFPEDYAENFKGKDVTFKVTIKEVKEKVLPELGEEFYQDLGYENIKTEEEFRKEVEGVLLERKSSEIDDKHLDECLKKACDNMKVEINKEIIDAEVHRMIHQLEHQLEGMHLDLDKYLNMLNQTHEDLHNQMSPEAINRIKARYLLEEIANQEKIDFTDEEVDKKTEEMAENYGISVDELVKSYGSKDVLKFDMRMREALEIIKNNN